MQKVIIIGAGGHAAEISDYIAYSNKLTKEPSIKIIGFLDDEPLNYSSYKFPAPLLGAIDGYTIDETVKYVIGIANLAYRRSIVDLFQSKKAKFQEIIHPTAIISPSGTIGKGNIVGPMVNIGPNVCVGDFNLLNSRASLGHDTIIGDFNFISPNVSFSGFSNIGDENLFGINSATIPGVSVGSRNKIMASMVLDKDILNDSTIFFRYKEKIIAVPKNIK